MQNLDNLMAEIISKSVSKDWKQAKLEWFIESASYAEKPKQCICLHEPIKNIYVIKNKNNNHSLEVGRICVLEFLGVNDKLIAYNMIREYQHEQIFSGMISFLSKINILTDWEVGFLDSIKYTDPNSLIGNQIEKRKEIVEKILQKLIE